MGSNLVMLAVVSPLCPTDTSRFSLCNRNCSKIYNLPMACPYGACSFAKVCNNRLLLVWRVLTSPFMSAMSISSLMIRTLNTRLSTLRVPRYCPKLRESSPWDIFSSRGVNIPTPAKERVSVSTISARSFSLYPS